MALNIRGDRGLYYKTGIDTAGLQKGSTKSKGILAGLTRSITKMDVFAAIGISAVIAFAKVTKAAYNFSKEFEQSMLEVATISDEVKENFEGISQVVIDLSKEVPESALVLTRALYQIASAGHTGAQGMEALEVSARLAVAAVTDTFVAADAMTTIMNAFGEAAGSAENIADKLFTTVRLGKTTLREFGPDLGTIAKLAESLGLTFVEMMAMLAESVKTLPTPIAITGIRGLLTALSDPQDEAVDFAKNMFNIELSMKRVREVGFQNFLVELLEATKDNKDALAKLFGNIRGLTSILSIATDEGGRFAGTMKEMTETTNVMNDAFTIMMESTENKWKLFSNNTKAILKPLGDWILNWVNTELGAVLNIMGAIDKQQREMIKRQRDTGDQAKIRERWEKLLGKETLAYKGKPFFEKVITPPGVRLENVDLKKKLKEIEKAAKEVGIEIEGLDFRFKAMFDTKDMTTRWKIFNDLIDEAMGKITGTIERKPVYDGETRKSFIKDVLAKRNEEILESDRQLAEDTTKILHKNQLDRALALEKEAKSLAFRRSVHAMVTEEDDKKELELLEKQIIERMKLDEEYREWKISNNEDMLEDEIESIEDEMELYDERTNFERGLIDELEKREEQLRRLRENALKLTEKQQKLLAKNIQNMNIKTIESHIKLLEIERDKFVDNVELYLYWQGKIDEAIVKTSNIRLESINDISDALVSMGNLISIFDSKLGASAQAVGMMARDIAGMVEAAATGNVAQEISSTVNLLEKIFSFFRKSETKKDMESFAQKGYDAVSGIRIELEFLNNTIAAYEKAISRYKAFVERTEFKTIEEYMQAQTGLRNLMDEYNEMLTGTTTESIASAITDGLMQGLDSAQVFADSFEDLMRNALIHAFETRTLMRLLDPFYDKFAELSEGGLTAEEVDELKDMWLGTKRTGKPVLGGDGAVPGIAESIEDAFEGMKRFFEEIGISLFDTDAGDATAKTGMRGAIKGITERTAGVLAGQLGAMRIDVRQIRDRMLTSQESLDLVNHHLLAISQKTSNLQKLDNSWIFGGRLTDINDRIIDSIYHLKRIDSITGAQNVKLNEIMHTAWDTTGYTKGTWNVLKEIKPINMDILNNAINNLNANIRTADNTELISEHTANLENMSHKLTLIHVALKYGGLDLTLNDNSMLRASGTN